MAKNEDPKEAPKMPPKAPAPKEEKAGPPPPDDPREPYPTGNPPDPMEEYFKAFPERRPKDEDKKEGA